MEKKVCKTTLKHQLMTFKNISGNLSETMPRTHITGGL